MKRLPFKYLTYNFTVKRTHGFISNSSDDVEIKFSIKFSPRQHLKLLKDGAVDVAGKLPTTL